MICGNNCRVSDTAAEHDSRSRVLQAIETAPGPVPVESIVAGTGLHPNTVRGHLDVLMAAGAVGRVAADAQGRGRPRWLYQLDTPRRSPFQILAEALAIELTQSADPAMAERAAERWAQALPELPVSESPDEAVASATESLNRLGFTAHANPAGDALWITNCPYAELVATNPAICDIHTALVGRLLEQRGQPVTIESMDVWARPGLCVAHLRRPDLIPARTILAEDRGSATSSRGMAS